MAARSGWSLSKTGTDRRFHTAGLEPLIELCFAEADQSAHLVEGHPSLVHEATDVPLRDPEMDSGVADAQKDGMMLHRSHPQHPDGQSPTPVKTAPNRSADNTPPVETSSMNRSLTLLPGTSRSTTVSHGQPSEVDADRTVRKYTRSTAQNNR